MTLRDDPGRCAQLACILEATARKAGNVHRLIDFDDLSYVDFLVAAAAVAGPMGRAREAGVGATVLAAVEATRAHVPTNANLGIVLLLAPLAAVPGSVDLRRGVADVIEELTVEDTRRTYRAIRLANPGGLGSSPEQDVGQEPTATLREAMCLAAGRDLVARQYASGFADLFDVGLPELRRLLDDGHDLETAIVGCHLELMARCPDTLIARKCGFGVAEESARRATTVQADGWPVMRAGRAKMVAFDRWLRGDGHRRNPGATADLTCAVLFAALRDGPIAFPLAGRRHFALDGHSLSRS